MSSIAPPSFPFNGNVFSPNDPGYATANSMYASSTYGQSRDLNPSEILQPTCIEDIVNVIKYYNQPEYFKPIAIRTGGHQYCGASSCDGNGVQLDLSQTFKTPSDAPQRAKDSGDGKTYIKSSVSWTLKDLYAFLTKAGLFLPTGQCWYVQLGGHAQSGGYGMLARSFGLLGDYIVSFDIVDASGAVDTISRTHRPDLFYGFLGGCIGNLGVLTHFKVEVQEDSNHQGSKGQWTAFLYNKANLTALLNILAKQSENSELDPGYDFGVNVYSEGGSLAGLFPGTEDELRDALPTDWLEKEEERAFLDLTRFKLPLIVVYAQWINHGDNTYSPDLFESITNVSDLHLNWQTKPGTPVSTIMSWWLFKKEREFDFPYNKRTRSSNLTNLSTNGWVDWFVDRVDVLNNTPGLFISSQIQITGGKNSAFINNASTSTAFSWRDATVVGTWDVFYSGNSEGVAAQWQETNDTGTLQYFDPDDRRLLWGSYGCWDMAKVWKNYYDSQTYAKLQQIKADNDPLGLFSANPFCVQATKNTNTNGSALK